MKNKLLYVSFVDFTDTRFSGVTKKIGNQIRVFENAGIESTLVTRYGKGVAVYHGGERTLTEGELGIFSRRVLCAAAEAKLSGGDYGCLFLRFQFFCGSVLRLLRAAKKMGMRVIVEIPTFPYEPELRMQGAKGYPKLWCDRFYRSRCTACIDRFVTYCDDKEIFGVPAIAVENGILMDSIPVTGCGYTPGRLDIISVSSMLPWHGVDRVLTGLEEYYRQGGKCDVRVHIVGDGGERPGYEALVHRSGLGTRVTFYGSLYGEALDDVFEKCSVGICTLGVHRRGEVKGSPLKTVEYLARGLAVASEIDLKFLSRDSEFRFNVPVDDSPLDIAGLVEFHDRLMSRGTEDVRRRIRRHAEQTCGMDVTLKKVLDYITSGQ